MKRLVPSLLLLAAGCTFNASGDGEADVATEVDASSRPPSDGTPEVIDAQPPVDAGRVCVGDGVVQVCEFASGADVVIPGGSNINTDTSLLCATELPASLDGQDVCLIWGDQINVEGDVVATGSRPLVLAAVTTIVTAGVIDVGSVRGGRIGAGAPINLAACAPDSEPEQDEGGAGGGAGGSFSGTGGDGGKGDLNDNGGVAGTADGGRAHAAFAAPTSLRGGCAGSTGAKGDGDGGIGGAGGGAVALVAGTGITLGGAVLASGAGGGGGTMRGGGGGGGAGGLIVLAAPTIASGVPLVANGGGGGEAGYLLANGNVWVGGMPGANGGDSLLVPAGGDSLDNPIEGNGEHSGGIGGDGTAGPNREGVDGGEANGGGGGGGGGAGYVFVYGTWIGDGIFSPPDSAP